MVPYAACTKLKFWGSNVGAVNHIPTPDLPLWAQVPKPVSRCGPTLSNLVPHHSYLSISVKSQPHSKRIMGIKQKPAGLFGKENQNLEKTVSVSFKNNKITLLMLTQRCRTVKCLNNLTESVDNSARPPEASAPIYLLNTKNLL